MLLAALGSVDSLVGRAQVCPIEVEGVSRQAINSELGASGAAIKVTYRNASRFSVRSIEFEVQALSTNDGVSRPGKIIANRELGPNEVDSLLWNSTRFDKQNASKPVDIIWPALVVMEDGSKFSTSASQCGYRTAQGEQPSKLTAPSAVTTPAADSSNSKRQLEDLINSGEASLVNVTSDPAGANVDVDEKLIGKTPLSFVLTRTTNGAPRSILVYKAGYTLTGRDVIPNGKTMTFVEKLTALTSR